MTKPCQLLLMALLLWPAAQSAAEEHRTCSGCGCCLRKVVRMECTTKEVVEHVYECECEDFALLGLSKKCHVPCSCPDGRCGRHDHVVWQPGHCGKPRTRKKLVKREVVKKVPTYRCVVEYVCDRCSSGNSCVDGQPLTADTVPAEDMPPMPPPPTARQGSDKLPLQPIGAKRSAFSWKAIFGS